MDATTCRREAARLTGVTDSTLMLWEQRGRIPSALTTAPVAYINAVMQAKFFADRMRSPRDVDAAMLMTQGGRTGDEVDPFHGVVLGIQREEKCSFNKAALLAEERDPEAYQEYMRRNTRGTPQFEARQASLRAKEPAEARTPAPQSETMQKIFEFRKQHMEAAKAEGRAITIMQADHLTFSEHPDLYLAYLKENTR